MVPGFLFVFAAAGAFFFGAGMSLVFDSSIVLHFPFGFWNQHFPLQRHRNAASLVIGVRFNDGRGVASGLQIAGIVVPGDVGRDRDGTTDVASCTSFLQRNGHGLWNVHTPPVSRCVVHERYFFPWDVDAS